MLSPVDIIIRLLVAALLGSLIGLERERRHWTAGLRTHMLVCVGAALFMIVSAYGFADALKNPNVVLDPSRVAAQVVSGIGFLGAGAILLRREVIRGLTTAASLWTVAAIGLASGGGLYFAAVSATVLILGILMGLKPLERRFVVRREQLRSLLVVVDSRITSPVDVEAALVKCGVWVQHIDAEPGSQPNQKELRVVIRADDLPAASEYLADLPGVEDVRGDRQ
ncbi:MAG: MgtC/SapB family protein [Gammaproteobacteria bacterium]|nr:MgtC/SapB family protein [Gammaproteobacteria bacterium]